MFDTLKLENQLCHRFYLLSNAFTRTYRPLLEKLDITYPQYIALMALWEKDEITIADLLEKTGIDGGAMSLILKKLTHKGYLNIQKSNEDKRVKLVRLTDTGKAIKAEAKAIPEEMLCKLKCMSLEEAEQLINLLDKLKGCFDIR